MTLHLSRCPLVAVIAGVTLLTASLGGCGNSGGGTAQTEGDGSSPSTRGSAVMRSRIDAALATGVERASRLGGGVEAAVMLNGWHAPLEATSKTAGVSRYMRMWSMSKVPTMVTVLQMLGWGKHPGKRVPPQLATAFRGALTRSENCRARRVVLQLQELSGGRERAREALARVFRAAGASVRVARAAEEPEALCVPYLQAQTELVNPLAPALLLGTSTWRAGDAVRLVEALSDDTYGAALSRRVLSLMRAPKLASREAPIGDLTAPLDWGAGRALAGLSPAYKAGWGGTLHSNFLAGQIALIGLTPDRHAALAVMFHPNVQPPRDDPGITAAPVAIQRVMASVRKSLAHSAR